MEPSRLLARAATVMAETFLASVLHLSDLHLGDRFDYNPKQIPGWLRQAWAVSRGRVVGSPHDSRVLGLVPTELRRIRGQLRTRYPEFTDFDVSVVSGDLLTMPFTRAEHDGFAYAWLTGTVPTQHYGNCGL